MAATANRYPLSTADGQAIPLEVVKPLAVLPISFVVASFTASPDLTDYQDKILVAFSDADCYISFLETPAAPVDNTAQTGTVYIPRGVAVSFVTNSPFLSVKGISLPGTVHVQIVDTWAGLSLETQIGRR